MFLFLFKTRLNILFRGISYFYETVASFFTNVPATRPLLFRGKICALIVSFAEASYQLVFCLFVRVGHCVGF